jgi:hypothetical protein
MTPTTDNREELRELIGEEIPAGKTEADTLFTTTQIDRLLSRAANIYEAAANGWRLKAAKLQQKLSELEEYSVGDETYKYADMQKAVKTALQMADVYDAKATSAQGKNSGVIIKINPPQVL